MPDSSPADEPVDGVGVGVGGVVGDEVVGFGVGLLGGGDVGGVVWWDFDAVGLAEWVAALVDVAGTVLPPG